MESQNIFKVIKPGLYTTFQDLGRIGLQKFGVPVSGAMDQYSLQMANILVGNDRHQACIEITLIGPELIARSPITLAITGANLTPKINSERVKMWTTLYMERGDVLTFGKQQSGVFSYIAVAGGYDCPVILGSCSTDVKSGFGKPLEINDCIKGYPRKVQSGIGLQKAYIPTYRKEIEVSIIEGPHTDLFLKNELEQFYSKVHILQANSNRMGYRFQSEVNWEFKENIWSDAIPFGGIQITPNGETIVLMADRQTTGGYPRIGTIATVDIPKIAQLIPGGTVKFKPITISESQSQLRIKNKALRLLENTISHLI